MVLTLGVRNLIESMTSSCARHADISFLKAMFHACPVLNQNLVGTSDGEAALIEDIVPKRAALWQKCLKATQRGAKAKVTLDGVVYVPLGVRISFGSLSGEVVASCGSVSVGLKRKVAWRT